jgi:hypothetical protein
MSLPLVIIFERHWDEIPKLVLKDLLPNLVEQGYQTLCFETPKDLTTSEIIARHDSGLKYDMEIQRQAEQLLKQVNITKQLSEESFSSLAQLMKQYVSSQRYLDVAEKIKNLPASKILKEIFDQAGKLSLLLKGVDIVDLDEMFSYDLSKRMTHINLQEDRRIRTIFKNLLKLRKKQEGVIFICGALHASNLLAKFAEKGMQDDVLYYFPHSSKRYDHTTDDINEITMRNETLQNHTYLLSKHQIQPFVKTIVSEIVPKIIYKEEIVNGNSHSRFLSEFFKVKLKAFLRPGYYVDALVDIDKISDIETIKQGIHAIGVQTHDVSLNERKYLVISAINTTEIAEKIRKL